MQKFMRGFLEHATNYKYAAKVTVSLILVDFWNQYRFFNFNFLYLLYLLEDVVYSLYYYSL